MDGTLNRTKKYLAYFGRSFLRDKIAVTLMCLICATIIAIIYVEIEIEIPKEPTKTLLGMGGSIE
jgi:hypothetical protein